MMNKLAEVVVEYCICMNSSAVLMKNTNILDIFWHFCFERNDMFANLVSNGPLHLLHVESTGASSEDTSEGYLEHMQHAEGKNRNAWAKLWSCREKFAAHFFTLLMVTISFP